MPRKSTLILIVSLLVIAFGLSSIGHAQEAAPAGANAPAGSSFTYQGQLKDASGPVTGSCDFQLSLWDALTGGTQVGSTLTQSGVAVSEGLFTVQLDFGANAFDGNARWLEIAVRCPAGSGAYNPLAPRQPLTPAPYALYSANADLLDGQHADDLQNRVSGACTVGSSIRAINVDGTVECEQPATFYSPLMLPRYLDLASVDSGLKGFVGGFSDGRYAYFVPNNNGSLSGKVARLDQNNYTNSGVTVLDLTTVDSDLKGFYGGFTDGVFGIFVPNNNGKAVQVGLWNFSTSGVAVLNLAAVDAGLKGFRGGFTDGITTTSCRMLTTADPLARWRGVNLAFNSGGVTVLDLAAVNSNLTGFNGGFTDGRYGYFVPYYHGYYHGVVARVDLVNFTPSGVTWLNLGDVDGDLAGFTSGFTDGRYAYFVPYRNNRDLSGKVARVDLANFTTSGVTVLDLGAISNGMRGFAGGFTDGRYGYFVPYSGNILARVDLANFTASGVTMRTTWFSSWGGAFTDGHYAYLEPFTAFGSPDGQVARIQLFAGVGGPSVGQRDYL